jgi:YHS domain-containing protein
MPIRVILLFIGIYLLYRVIKFIRQAKPVSMDNRQFKPAPITGEDLVEDPVCHTYIPVSQAYKQEIAGKSCYFCSKECYEDYILQKSKERQQ